MQQAAAGAAQVGAAAGAQQVGAAAGAQQVGAAGAQQLVLWQQPSFGSLILQQALLNPQQAFFTRSPQQRTFLGLQQCVVGAQQDGATGAQQLGAAAGAQAGAAATGAQQLGAAAAGAQQLGAGAQQPP